MSGKPKAELNSLLTQVTHCKLCLPGFLIKVFWTSYFATLAVPSLHQDSKTHFRGIKQSVQAAGEVCVLTEGINMVF